MPIYNGNNKVNLSGLSKVYDGENLVWKKVKKFLLNHYVLNLH